MLHKFDILICGVVDVRLAYARPKVPSAHLCDIRGEQKRESFPPLETPFNGDRPFRIRTNPRALNFLADFWVSRR